MATLRTAAQTACSLPGSGTPCLRHLDNKSCLAEFGDELLFARFPATGHDWPNNYSSIVSHRLKNWEPVELWSREPVIFELIPRFAGHTDRGMGDVRALRRFSRRAMSRSCISLAVTPRR